MLANKHRNLKYYWDYGFFHHEKNLENDDQKNEVMILKDNLVKVKTTKEYSFGNIKLLHIQEENSNKENFRILGCGEVELTADEAKVLANVIKDIYREEDNDGGHQVREGDSNC